MPTPKDKVSKCHGVKMVEKIDKLVNSTKTLHQFVEEAVKEFEKKFITKSVFGIAIGAIDNLNQSGLQQVQSFLREKLLQSATLTAEALKCEKNNEEEIKLDREIWGDSAITTGWNAALTEIETKKKAWFERK
jgi:hypothetical protein